MLDIFNLAVAKAINGDSGGGGNVTLLNNKDISANGTYKASDDSADGYKKVTVSVANSYAAADEGKVVSSGALVSQTAHATVTQNGTVDTTTNNSVEVAVPLPSGTKQISITQNGTTTENVSGYASAEISVNVSGGGGTLLADYTASQDVSTILINSGLGEYPVYAVKMSGTLSANEWVYPELNGVSQTSDYFSQTQTPNFEFYVCLNANNDMYGSVFGHHSSTVKGSAPLASIGLHLYAQSAVFKSGFNVKVWGVTV